MFSHTNQRITVMKKGKRSSGKEDTSREEPKDSQETVSISSRNYLKEILLSNELRTFLWTTEVLTFKRKLLGSG